ncbi:MAG TPA: hypothetical protein VF897_10515 [Roseiflexaceae bacterium]
MKISPTRAAPAALARARRRPDVALIAALLVALALHALLWGRVPRTGLISDEGEYLSAASWLAHGRGFSWYQSYLWTRAPVYPLFVAAHLKLFGDALTPIYVTQTLLSLVNIALVYLLAKQLVGDGRLSQVAGRRSQLIAPALAALLMAVYFPFALYAQVLLSETLFITLLLGGFLALARWSPTSGRAGEWASGRVDAQSAPCRPVALSPCRPWRPLVVAGVLFGLATLTRSLTLFFLPLAALWVLLRAEGRAQRTTITRRAIRRSLLFVLCSAAVIVPWTIYSSRIYGGLVVVDTSGAFNLLYGARTAYDGNRNDATTRDYALVLLGQKPAGAVPTQPCAGYPDPLPASQAGRQAAMTREALCLVASKPAAFVTKSLAELVDLFQINYTGAERFADDFTSGRLPRWYALGLFLLDDTIYVLALPLAVIGWALARKRSNVRTFERLNVQTLIGLWWLYNIAVAPLLFAINRFRLPLLPFAFIFAAYALVALAGGGWRGLRSRSGVAYAALAGLLLLIAATPYAYLQAPPSSWASYLGPYPSSLAITRIALAQRPLYERGQRGLEALAAGNLAEAQAILQSGEIAMPRADGIAVDATTLGRALLAGRAGRPGDGLALLPPLQAIVQQKDVEAAVVRGDLLRSTGDLASARATFTQTLVDDNNPIQWAWDWLRPAGLPGNRIDLAGNLDLGYVEGCYLGEGDPAAQGNFRWCGDGARLRFPSAGSGAPQTLVLRVDGRGWAGYAPAAPEARVFAGGQAAGAFTPELSGPTEFSVALPPTPRGADVVVTLRTSTFVPPAERYLSQQGKSVVGQVQRLGLRIDWAALREPTP